MIAARVKALLGLVMVGILYATAALAQPTVILVRHGEKLDGSSDTPLSPVGTARAQRLADMLGVARLDAVYVTEFRRTRLLAEPLAGRLGLTPVTIPGRDIKALVNTIAAHGRDETVLVVGHSNTIPVIIANLGGPADIMIAEEDFDNLFILTPNTGGPANFLRLKY